MKEKILMMHYSEEKMSLCLREHYLHIHFNVKFFCYELILIFFLFFFLKKLSLILKCKENKIHSQDGLVFGQGPVRNIKPI